MNSSTTATFPITDDSMAPEFIAGDKAIYALDIGQDKINDGDYCYVMTSRRESIRRVHLLPDGRVKLLALNPRHRSRITTWDKVLSCYAVTWKHRKLGRARHA